MQNTPSAQISYRMRRTRGRDNDFEKAVRSSLFARGVRFRIHFPVPGMPRRTCDLALPSKQIAVFLDGCFWHGCPDHLSTSKTNQPFWEKKIRRNRERDRETSSHLSGIGWTVLRFWEHQDTDEIVESICDAVSVQSRNSIARRTPSRILRPLDDL